ncbi:MAG TPA: glycosyltransferase [Dokdonella sp.]|uniref:glycosyltransferase family 2 protein n=1 Tax=Dokdonella sp. TaxID=2291710 RepID=UPI002CB4F84C|nr:glycosyltransferase [Dokdonella sp.]HOX72158.1 glycosyltransferase [Dokdonella sp.]HPG93243.1 glycosyltransferase [Dokdonella sp.]HPN77993.1 glycosyltransferase [Dokdonella sp.]
MTAIPEISAIIPTYNRRDLVIRAIKSALAQTRKVEEIIVIDDGSTDGTDAALKAAFGDRILYVRQANAGVSAARNRGMAMSRGRYIALLDSDDEWLPEKTARQVEWLDAHTEFGMVLCDVERVDGEGRMIDRFRRRDVIREDGWVLSMVLQDPALAPVSAMFRREVFADIGGFDENLATAEDLDFHLRVASRWRIGVVEEILARAVRGQDGLSALARTYDDYTKVIERAVSSAEGRVPRADAQRALAAAYLRNARGAVFENRFADAMRWIRKARSNSSDRAIRREARSTGMLAVKRIALNLLGRGRR